MKRTMKTNAKSIISALLMLALTVCLVCSLVACNKPDEQTDVWKNAKYSSQTELGEGERSLVVEVTADEKTVTFTVKTDKTTVGEALLDCNLISGEAGQYGLYVKEVNGIVADYDVDGTYWAFYVNGEYAMTGVDTTEITEGVVYQLVRSR